MIKKIFFLVLILLVNIIVVAQVIPSFDEFEVYTQDKDNKILIIPFENKMYASSIDNELAEFNSLKYYDIKEEIKRGISSQILLTINKKTLLFLWFIIKILFQKY